ncbi:MAG: hypothetical protein ACETWB_07940 [Anaerolineae bacterium]
MTVDEESTQLPSEVVDLLRKLNEMGAATPIELAIKLRRGPEEVRPELQRLLEEGLLEVRSRDGHERQIYRLNKDGRRLIR